MTSTRLHLVIVLIGMALLGVYWAAGAQEGRPVWAPPPVLPPDDAAPKKAAPKAPLATKPSRGKPSADPTFIIPPEVYDKPHARTGFVTDEMTDVLQVGGVLPTFPPLPPVAKEEKAQTAPPAVPLLPAPLPEPTKTRIADLPNLPAILPENKPASLAPMPPAVPSAPALLPENKSAPPAPPPTVSFPAPVRSEQPKSFVRIRPSISQAPADAPPVSPPTNLTPPDFIAPLAPAIKPASLASVQPGSQALVTLQTPTITVKKLGPVSFHANELIAYSIVVRNLSNVPAQYVRIEDEIPQGTQPAVVDPGLQIQGNKAIWVLPTMLPNSEQILQLSLRTVNAGQSLNHTSVQVSAVQQAAMVTALRPQNPPAPGLTVQLQAPAQAAIGNPAMFEIRVTNQSNVPLTNIVLFGSLPEGFNTKEGREIEGSVAATIAPGESKVLKMPVTAVKAGRYTVSVKVASNVGEASATTSVEVGTPTLLVQQLAMTRLVMGRDGDLRIELTNHTGKTLRNIAVADQLAEGLDFISASDRGLYQANSRMVHWMIYSMTPGQTRTLVVRVQGAKVGQFANIAAVRADGIAPIQSSGTVTLEGVADLSLRVIDRDNPLEIGRETVYEIRVANPGSMPASGVQLKVLFPPGLVPKKAEGKTRYTVERQTIVFEPLDSLAAQDQAIYRVSALAQTAGDQRVRFAVVCDQVRTPIQREISTRVVRD